MTTKLDRFTNPSWVLKTAAVGPALEQSGSVSRLISRHGFLGRPTTVGCSWVGRSKPTAPASLPRNIRRFRSVLDSGSCGRILPSGRLFSSRESKGILEPVTPCCNRPSPMSSSAHPMCFGRTGRMVREPTRCRAFCASRTSSAPRADAFRQRPRFDWPSSIYLPLRGTTWAMEPLCIPCDSPGTILFRLGTAGPMAFRPTGSRPINSPPF